jgi:hypothetical protein
VFTPHDSNNHHNNDETEIYRCTMANVSAN